MLDAEHRHSPCHGRRVSSLLLLLLLLPTQPSRLGDGDTRGHHGSFSASVIPGRADDEGPSMAMAITSLAKSVTVDVSEVPRRLRGSG